MPVVAFGLRFSQRAVIGRELFGKSDNVDMSLDRSLLTLKVFARLRETEMPVRCRIIDCPCATGKRRAAPEPVVG